MNILNPYTWLIGALAVALVGGSAYLYGRSDGKDIERVAWQAQKIKADADHADKLAEVTAAANTKTAAHAVSLVSISTEYQQELKNERTKKDRLIADLRAGAIRLRDPGTRYSLGANALPTIGTSPSRCDGDAGTEISGSTAEFLISEASHSDEITRQLTACQGIVRADRR